MKNLHIIYLVYEDIGVKTTDKGFIYSCGLGIDL